MTIAQFPHCDSRVLHGPNDGCEFCDLHPEWQELRKAWGIAFTGHQPKGALPECGKRFTAWERRWTCHRPTGHGTEGGDHGAPRGHSVRPEWERLPCPADAARPPGGSSDHRRWGGNKPTSARGDPSWPAETAASHAMYGDQGGRTAWPLPERIARRARRPFEDWAKRRRGWRKENGFWRYPG